MKRTKKSRCLWFGLLMATILTLPACGGGGGGDGDDNPPAPIVTKASVVVGGRAGSATQLSSLVATPAGEAPAPIDPALADAKVTLEVIKGDGTSCKYYTVTDDHGAYALTAEITIGDVVTVTFEKEGFTTFSKTLDTTGTAANEKRQYVVNGKATQTGIIVSPITGDVFKAGGGTAPGFRFGLMRAAKGVQRAFASSNDVRRAATYDGSKPELDINIPGSWAPEATAITARLAAFDPADPIDRAMFPGEFVGVGGGTATTAAVASKAALDQTAYPLESVSFFSAEVTPNTGNQLVTPARAIAAGVAKAAVPGSALIYKYIPADGCMAIQKYADRDLSTAGVQVPLYTYRSSTGKWGYLGEGTLATYSGGEYFTAAVAAAATSLANLACGTTDYYFAIETADWTTWWNLDYPILLEAPKTVTLCGTVVDQATNGRPIPGAYVVADGYAKGSNSFHYSYAGNDGKFQLDVLSTTGKTLGEKYDFAAYDNNSWPAPKSTVFPLPTGVLKETGCNDIGNVVVPSINTGMIEGTILEDLTPMVNQWIWVESLDSSNYFYNRTQTDANGKFAMKAPTNRDLNVGVLGKSYPTNINALTAGFEESDADTVPPSKVTLKPIILANSPPEVSTWITPNPAKVGKNVTLSAWAWDPEGDVPLIFEWKIDNVIKSTASEFVWVATAGEHTVVVVVTDKNGQGKSTTITQTLAVAAAGNSLPVIYYTAVTPAVTCGDPSTLGIYAYDPDGDPLTYTLGDATGGMMNNFASTTAPVGSLLLTVSDNKGGSVTRTILVPAASQLELYAATAWPLTQTINNEVQLYAYAYSNSTAGVSYLWTVTDPDGSPVLPDAQNKFTPSKVGDYTIVVTADDGCSSDTRTFTVTVAYAEVIFDATIFSGQQIIVNQTVTINLTGIELPAGTTFELKDLTQPAAMGNGTTLNPTWTPTTQVTHTLELTVNLPGIPAVKKTLNVIVNPQGQTTVDVDIN